MSGNAGESQEVKLLALMNIWGQRAPSGPQAVKGGRAGSCGVKVTQVQVMAKEKVRCLDKN